MMHELKEHIILPLWEASAQNENLTQSLLQPHETLEYPARKKYQSIPQ